MKLVKVRDDNIIIHVLAIKVLPANQVEQRVLIQRHGFEPDGSDIILMDVESRLCTANPYDWSHMGVHPRTLPAAHFWIKYHFDGIQTLPDRLPVIDVRALMGASVDPVWSDISQDGVDGHRYDG